MRIVAGRVRSCARPRLSARLAGESGPHRIPFHMAQCHPSMTRIEGARVVAILPQLAGAPAADVQLMRVASVGAAECHRQRPTLFGHSNQMNVIRHQAMRENSQARLLRRGPRQAQVNLPVRIREEGPLAVRATLRDVVRHSNRDQAWKTCHRNGSVN